MNKNQERLDGNAFRFLPWLLILFAGSGCAALIYEIVWYQLLQLVIGSTTVSLGVLLATFMGGLCLGSIALPRLAAARGRHPLRIYALIEIGIGICGIAALFGMPLVDQVYTTAVGHGMGAILLRAVVCAVCLLPPTFLMGASLPAIASWIETTPRGVAWLGLFYGGNTVGAVFGCLLAGFYLLRVFDMATATYVAAAINLAVALASFALAGQTPNHATDDDALATSPAPVIAVPNAWPVYVTIAISGACALGAEVVWTRLMGLMLGATVYTFSIILAVFLVGLAIGSGWGAFMARVVRTPAAIGVCQILLTVAIAWTAFMLAKSIPYWPILPRYSNSPWITFQIDLVRVIWTVLPGTLLWGASFPLALAAIASRNSDPGRLVGSVYAANTAGAIVGALAFSLVLIPWVGTQQCERILIVLSAVGGLIVLVPYVWATRAKVDALLLVASMVVAGILVAGVSAIPAAMTAYGRLFMTLGGGADILYVGEGINSTIAVSQLLGEEHVLQFHVAGKVEASTAGSDMRVQRMLGHIPALIHPKAQSVLVVGFGAGVTAGSFVVQPDIKRILICEIEPLIPPTSTKYFAPENYDVLHDKRTQIVYDDARHYILTSPEKFDIITSDPIHPWVKGSATLYSKEYFELVKKHLNPGGMVTQWVPLYESDAETVKSEIATFFDVFPNGSIWANEYQGGGYDVLLLGENGPAKIDVDQLQARMDDPAYARVVKSLNDVGLGTVTDLLSTYAGQSSDLSPWLKGAQINRDGNLRLQYMAGMAVNVSNEGAIYDDMLRYRRFPDNLMVGSDQHLLPLRTKFNNASANGPAD